MRNIGFRNVRNYFKDKLKEDIKEIRSSKNFFADTSANLYEMAETNQNRLLSNNISSYYRKFQNGVKQKLVKETKKQLNR